MVDNDWKLYIKFTDDDYFHDHREDYKIFVKNLRQQTGQMSRSTLNYFAANWRLPYNPLYLKLGGVDLSKTDPNLFNRIKTILRKRGEGKVCWGCGVNYKVGETSLAAHEHWIWDDTRHIRQLAAIRFLCKECHYLSHHAYWLIKFIPNEEIAKRLGRFCKINECTFFEAYAHLESSFKLCNQRQKLKWKIDLSPIGQLILEAEEKQKVKPRV